MSSYPDAHRKKATLLDYFRNYMSEHLIKAGGSAGEGVWPVRAWPACSNINYYFEIHCVICNCDRI